MTKEDSLVRCDWCEGHPLYVAYHDEEWGLPEYDDDKLFEFLILEGAQAGLSWLTILKKRENFRRAFDNFDATRIARYGSADRKRLLADSGIIRNRLKVDSAINNAGCFENMMERGTSFATFLWSFVDHRPVQNRYRRIGDVPAQTEASRTMSRALKKEGFKFVGPTICYAFMQATGMVNDHLVDCHRHEVCRQAGQ